MRRWSLRWVVVEEIVEVVDNADEDVMRLRRVGGGSGCRSEGRRHLLEDTGRERDQRM